MPDIRRSNIQCGLSAIGGLRCGDRIALAQQPDRLGGQQLRIARTDADSISNTLHCSFNLSQSARAPADSASTPYFPVNMMNSTRACPFMRRAMRVSISLPMRDRTG